MTENRKRTVRETRRLYHSLDCRMGRHRRTPTFRPGEEVCLNCGAVFYCMDCLKLNHLPPSTAQRLYPFPCPHHHRAAEEVQS
jgi:hypothetical protein